jgi:hypothetical protein
MNGFRWMFRDKRQLPLARTELARARSLGLGGQVIETALGFVLLLTIDPARTSAYQEWSWGSTLCFPRAAA